jgi:tripartite-type tricarboxylate transporter receptor subunit TctC
LSDFHLRAVKAILARLMGQWLSGPLGQQNRPSAGSNIGSELVVRALADGYTLLVGVTPIAINATLYDNLSFNFVPDVAVREKLANGAD